jgi:glycosyltransferase involved in cell wall biosynthesis
MKKKICMLTSVHPAFDTRIFYKETKSLVKAGYDVTLIAPHTHKETVDGVKICPLPKPRNRLERMTKVLWKLFRLAITAKADAYHFHDPELIPIGLMLKILGKKVIYDVHENYREQIPSKDWIPKPFKKIVSILTGGIETLAARYFDAIITVTEAIEKQFKEKTKTVILYNFPSLELFKSTNPKIDNLFDIIHVGVLSRGRLAFIYSVALELKKMGYEYKWCIIGMQSELKNWAEKKLNQKEFKKVKKDFVLMDRVEHKDLIKYLWKSKIGINYHPPEKRLLEAIPVKMFEYMACELPVVCSNLTVMRKFLENENCVIFVKDNDIRQFANGIEYLLSHPKKAKEMGNNGREVVFRKYNWDTEEKKLIALYKNFLKRK